MNYINLQDEIGAWLMDILGIQAILTYTNTPKPDLPYCHFYFTNLNTVGQDERLAITETPAEGEMVEYKVRGLRSFTTSLTCLDSVEGGAFNRLAVLQDVMYLSDKMKLINDIDIVVSDIKPVMEIPTLYNDSQYESKAVVDIKMNTQHLMTGLVYIIESIKDMEGTIVHDGNQEKDIIINIP